MSTIHFIGGEKGGVGKSVFARLLSQYMIDNNITYKGLDADQSHGTLTRSYQEFTAAINLDDYESIDTIMEMALEEEQHLVIDLPAQSERFLNHWIEDNDVLGMCEEMQIKVIYWYIVDDGTDSADLLKKFLKKYTNALSCVVVKNEGRGSDFAEIDATLEKASGTAEHMVTDAELPALHTPTMHKIDKLNFSFWGAAHLKESKMTHLNIMERQRTKVWMRKSYTMISDALATV